MGPPTKREPSKHPIVLGDARDKSLTFAGLPKEALTEKGVVGEVRGENGKWRERA